jgi:hypothetical protein
LRGTATDGWSLRGFHTAFLIGLFLLPWGSFPPFPFLHPHAQWADVAFAAAAVFAVVAWRQVPRPPAAFGVAVCSYVVWAWVAWIVADRPAEVPRAHLLGLVELGALAMMAASLGGGAEFRRLWTVVAGSNVVLVCAACLLGLALAAFGVETPFVGSFGDLVPGGYRRVQGGLWHPNMLASVCLLLLAGVNEMPSSFAPTVRRVLVALLGLTVLLTFSRTLLSFALALLALRLWGTSHRRLIAAAALPVVAFMIALTLLNVRLDPSRPWEARLVESPSPRLEGARTSLNTFVAFPWAGIGPGRSPGQWHGRPFDAHLTPLNVAATLGGPGLVFFLALPLVAWKCGARAAAPWCALFAVGTDALATDVEEFRHVFVLLGLAAARRSSGP